MVHSFLQAYLKDKVKIQPMVPKRHLIPDSIAEVESPALEPMQGQNSEE